VLVVDAPGWQAPSFALALLAQIVLSVVGVGAVVLVLGSPLARDLERVRSTLQRFGDEDLTARVGALRTRDVAPVGEAIDAMAGRVEALVEDQRALLQTVSHELRTPHARLRFRLERLAVAEDGEARTEVLAQVEQDLDEVDALLSELLAYVRVDGSTSSMPSAAVGQAEEAEDLELADWLIDVVARADFGETSAEVRLEVAPGLPLPLAPRASFERAVGNIVRNARRHARARVEVRARRVPGDRLEVTVEDDGPGIAPEDRARLVRPFEVGHDRLGPDSVGLGLAIASRVLARARGELRVDTAPIGGARITTTWPIRS
jgi:signal transduction histidine kinase